MDRGTVHEIGGVREKGDGLSLPRLKGVVGGAPQQQDGVTAGEAPWVNCAASRSLRQRRKSVSDRSEKLITPIRSPPASLRGDTGQCACMSVGVCAGACTRVTFHVSRQHSCRAADGRWGQGGAQSDPPSPTLENRPHHLTGAFDFGAPLRCNGFCVDGYQRGSVDAFQTKL